MVNKQSDFGIYFQDYKLEHSDDPLVVILNIFTAIFYMSHIIVPIVLGIVLYSNKKDDIETKRFSFTFYSVSFLVFLTFIFFPVAPPLYIWNKGQQHNFEKPKPNNTSKDPGVLGAIDKMLNMPFFENIYNILNSSACAAFPNLHNAYAMVVAIYSYRSYKKKGNLIIFYPLGMAFSSVWLNHHYIIDILGSLI